MSAIAGIAFWKSVDDPQPFLDAAGESMLMLGPDRTATCSLGGSAFLKASRDRLADDDGPSPFLSGGFLIVASARIDNRDALATELGLENGADGPALILACWKRWGNEAPRYLLGDFALAVWDEEDRSLSLARSPLASRELYYHSGPDFAAFASLPQALGGVHPRRLHRPEMARRLGGGTYFGARETMFSGIFSVEPGTLVRISRSATTVSRYWDPRAVSIVRRPRADAARELAWQLERAVTACAKRGDGPLASQLSGGRDSGAVTATAALVQQKCGEGLIALTAAPRIGFPEAQGAFVNDESAAAGCVAGQFPSVRHIVARTTRTPVCDAIDQANRILPAPMGNMANFGYWTRLLQVAADADAAVMLTGVNGNFSISLGGEEAVPDLLRQEGIAAWARAGAKLIRSGDMAPRTFFNQSFGSHLPEWLHAGLRAAVWGDAGHGYPAFSAALRDEIAAVGARPRSRPLASYRERIAEIYLTAESGDNIGRGLYGVELRDPTADRRLIEFCLSLPAADLVGSRTQRPIYDLAFADRVPAEVRASRRRGIQGADWFEIYDPEELRAGMRRYGAHPLVRELIDAAAVDDLFDRWPTSPGDDLATYALFANHLLGAVALASWLYVNF